MKILEIRLTWIGALDSVSFKQLNSYKQYIPRGNQPFVLLKEFQNYSKGFNKCATEHNLTEESTWPTLF